MWEPIFIGTNLDPFYDERLTWEGRRDKMTQVRFQINISLTKKTPFSSFKSNDPSWFSNQSLFKNNILFQAECGMTQVVFKSTSFSKTLFFL
jgi:hypothetical protein